TVPSSPGSVTVYELPFSNDMWWCSPPPSVSAAAVTTKDCSTQGFDWPIDSVMTDFEDSPSTIVSPPREPYITISVAPVLVSVSSPHVPPIAPRELVEYETGLVDFTGRRLTHVLLSPSIC